MFANPSITVKVVRRFRTHFICPRCSKPASTGQHRIYNKQEQNYTCSNFIDCVHCKLQYGEPPVIVPEYIKHPRLDDNCFEDVVSETTLPVGMGECVSVEIVRINLK